MCRVLGLGLIIAAGTAAAQNSASPPPPNSTPAPVTPSQIVAAAPAGDWIAIAPQDLLIMTLAPDRAGRARNVVIQLMPAPFSQGWVANMRMLAQAHWYDGMSVVRVQDNYVTQWGDPDGEDPAKAKPLPPGLRPVPESDYVHSGSLPIDARIGALLSPANDAGRFSGFAGGFAFSGERVAGAMKSWPMHCYGSVGVGRNVSPDTGTGAELYAVIGHAPRQLDRNIAVVGRVIEGIEHLSSLPRGTGDLGFYEKPAERVAILSVRLASDLPRAAQPRFQYLSTASESFARYAYARANRKDDFFIEPAGSVDICNLPVPVRLEGRGS
ncbi:peptidylprolyl isomerase [Sphingobium sp. CR28]|uniref:peptidylprolyl isomerase n=1 Tax=Sphingobium sp. CR28 TaxID=3400272 RepID=UPI003FEFC4A9